MQTLETKDPTQHAANIGNGLQELIEHLRQDIKRVDEPKAQALFETSAEVLKGLQQAFAHYEKKSEEVWQRR